MEHQEAAEKALIEEIGKLSSKEFQTLYESETEKEIRLELLVLRCASDQELFAKVFFPHYCTREFNDFHHDFFQTVQYGERNVRRVRAAPRGSAKSTLATLVKPIHDVCYGLEKFILIFSSTTPLANKKLKDIRAEILANGFLRLVYGVRFPKKKVGESEFAVVSNRGRTYFAALGRGAEVRGIRINEDRPTKVLCDDVEHSDEVYNEKVRSKTESWFLEDVSKVGDSGTNIDFVGTILHKDSLLSKLLKNPAYDGQVFKAIISWSERQDLWEKWNDIYINKDKKTHRDDARKFYEQNKTEMLRGTKVLWPEKEDYYAHMIDLAEIGKRSFMKEKQNEPQGDEGSIFERIHWYREETEGLRIESSNTLVPWANLTCLAAMDPATGQDKAKKGSGDFTVLGVGYKDTKDRLFLHWDSTKRESPTRFISRTFDVHERFNFERMALETNLYRNLLMENIVEEKRRREIKNKSKGIKIQFYEVENTENKRERIYRLEPKVNNAWILFNRALSREFMLMFEDFPNADHDDSPDMVEMMWNLANNRYKPSGIGLNVMASR